MKKATTRRLLLGIMQHLAFAIVIMLIVIIAQRSIIRPESVHTDNRLYQLDVIGREEEFEETINFVKEISFDKVHVFPYSIREGTKAAKMQGHLQNAIKSERANRLSAVCEDIRSKQFKLMAGKTVSVLFEMPKDGYACGYTKNYTPVRVKTEENLSGKIRDVLITETFNDFCIGEII